MQHNYYGMCTFANFFNVNTVTVCNSYFEFAVFIRMKVEE
jgi:hypothetical protein